MPHELVHRLRAAYDRSSVDDFWYEEVGCGFVSVVLVAGLLEVCILVGYTESVRRTRLTLILLSTLSTLLLLLFSSLGGGLSRLLVYLKVSGSVAFLRQGWMLCTGIGLLSVDRDLLGRCYAGALG